MRDTIISACMLASLAQPALAATYYVDAVNGNDGYPGTQSSTGASNGPWQSIGRVNAAPLAPGDQVRLRCGDSWMETLAPLSSGSASSPIYIGAYPDGCTSAPTVLGSDAIPWSAWEHHSGAVYRTVLPANLLNNGAFNNGTTGWRTYSDNGGASVTAQANCVSAGDPCVSVTSGPGPAGTLLSSERFGLRNSAHSVSFMLKAPSGSRIRAVVRRDDAPWDVVGLSHVVTGTGAWQQVTTSFVPTRFLTNARLDFELPPATSISLDKVQVQVPMPSVRDVYVSGATMLRARHPNRTTTQYLPMAGDADSVLSGGKWGSTYAVIGSPSLPAGGALSPGVTIRLRTNSWLIDDRLVTSVAGDRVYLNTPSSHPLQKGWGYYLTGALWMLDQPGEWHFDAASSTLYVWMPDSAHPGNKVTVGARDVGIDLSSKQNIVVESIAVRQTRTAVRAPNSHSVTLRHALIADSALDGIDASGAVSTRIENSTIERTGRDAIAGINHSTGATATGMRVMNNHITESGVLLKDGQVVSLPIRSFAAVRPGAQAQVIGNRIVHSGYNGIYPSPGSTISSNYIEGACQVIDDCGGIYMYGAQAGTRVEGNLIVRIPGARDGKPQGFHSPTEGRGIYLDEQTTGVTVAGNTVVDADHGIHVHNSSSNRVQNNTLYGNRLYQLWLQSTSNIANPAGDVFNNDVLANTMVPSGIKPSVLQQTKYGNVAPLASFNDNRYSSLKASQTAQEIWSGGERLYTFPEWQSAKDLNGVPRYLDVNGSHVTPSGYASYRINGTNQIPNGNLANGTQGWAAWSQSAPYSTMTSSRCAVGTCLNYVSGSGFNILSSPNFSVVGDTWYRVSFDLMTPVDGTGLVVGVRRGGGGTNGYEWLMSAPPTVYGSGSWKRFSFVFQASKTVNALDPVTKDWGARLDFTVQTSGAAASIANVEMVPVLPVGMALRTDVLLNPFMQSTAVNCPATGTDAAFCTKYVKFSDGSAVSWPYTLGPLGSEIVYSRGDTLTDADGDGIPDVQDRCPNTTSGANVNALGCGLGQSPS